MHRVAAPLSVTQHEVAQFPDASATSDAFIIPGVIRQGCPSLHMCRLARPVAVGARVGLDALADEPRVRQV